MKGARTVLRIARLPASTTVLTSLAAVSVSSPNHFSLADCGTCSRALVEAALQIQLAIETMPPYAEEHASFPSKRVGKH